MERLSNLAVQQVGEGFPVLIVHGWTMSGAVEAVDFEPVFTQKSGYKRIYIDLPGMGRSPASGITDMDSILDRVTSFIRQNILPSKFLLIGTSAGAYLAQALAYRHADAVEGLLLRVPLVEPADAKRDVDPFKPAIANETLLLTLSNTDRKQLGTISVQTPGFIEQFRHKLQSVWKPAMDASDSAILEPIRNDANRYRLAAAMHSPKAPFLKPTLILTGRRDTVVGYRDAWPLMECYPRATFVVLDRGDHGLPVDEVDLFVALVSNWLWRAEELQG